jgi:hypothetical protein
MRKHIANALAAVALAGLGGSASAGDQPVTLVPHGGYAPGCSPCAAGCATVERGGFYGSVGILYLKQTGTRDLAWTSSTFSEIDRVTGETVVIGTGKEEFDHDYDWSGRLDIGWKSGSGLGVRARYFWYHNSETLSTLDATGIQTDAAFPGVAFNQITGDVIETAAPLGVGFSSVGTEDSPSIFTAGRDLKVQTWDLDLTADCTVGCSLEVTYSAGLRWVHISSAYDAADVVVDPALIALPDVIPAIQAIHSRHTLNGFGPTVGVEGRYAISSGLKGFGAARFGLLWAEGSQTAVGGELPGPLPDGVVFRPLQALRYGATHERHGVLPTGELELGGEWGKIIGCNGPELFVRGSMLTQVYWGAGTSARVNYNNNPANEDLIFFGFAATVGIRY